MACTVSTRRAGGPLRIAGLALLLLAAALPGTAAREGAVHDADVCVYGGTSAGVAAAVAARRQGKSVALVATGSHLGGMTASGLGITDVGSSRTIGGIAREFYGRVQAHYLRTYGPDSPQLRDCAGGFRFEPHVAEQAFGEMVRDADVPVFLAEHLRHVDRSGNRIQRLEMASGRVFRARVYIDATYEGDLMARAGVTYTVGREPNSRYGETLNGVQPVPPNHNFRLPVDPYVVEGDPASGLLRGISSGDPGRQGDGDRRIQAYCFRMCLTDVPENMLPFPKPAGYDADRYTLLARYIRAGVWDALLLQKLLPNAKTDTNNSGAFSTDFIGMSAGWPEGDAATRRRLFREHLEYQQGLMWFLIHDERVSWAIRQEVGRWGLAKDEFTATEGWPHELYVREARRMVAPMVMTEHHCRGRMTVEDAVGLGSYALDCHNVQRVVVEGRVSNEGNVEVGGFPPYPISYRSLVPKESECGNLLVPVCLSASHAAYGSLRMEPVFMILGHSAAVAAAQALDTGMAVQRLDVRRLQQRLRDEQQVIEWGRPAELETRVDPRSLKGVVLDESDAVRVGEWKLSTADGARRIGAGYLHDGNANKGRLAVTYEPDLPEAGPYDVVLHFPPNANRASGVPVTLQVDGVGSVVRRVDQRNASSGGTVSLGTFKLPAGKGARVTVSNEETDGYVVADAVQFIRQGLKQGN